MTKRSSYEIKEKIMLAVREKPATYAELERKVNTGYRSIKSNCEELRSYEFVSIVPIERHKANGRLAFQVKITPRGLDTIQHKKKK